MQLKSRSGLVLLALALAASAVSILVMVSRLHVKVAGLRGGRLVAFLVGAAAFAVASFLFHRALRRRAQLAAIAELLPTYRRQQRLLDGLVFEDADLEDELSGRFPGGRSEGGAATRALLVSLEEEIGCEPSARRRAGRPACRRARLRQVGRLEPRRRRVPVRLATAPS